MKRIGSLALVVVAACGGGKSEPGKNVLGVTFDSADVHLVIGESKTVSVMLARPASLGDQAVELTVTGVPTGVIASFDAASVSGNNAKLVLSATADATRGENTIVVTATPVQAPNQRASSSANLALIEPAPITVHGVVRLTNDTPAVDAIVHVLGYRSTTAVDAITDSTGEFTVANIAPPYDVNVVFEPEGTTLYINNVFLDQMSATPFFGMTHVEQASQPSSMTLTGQVTGGDDTDHVDAVVDCDSGQEARRGTVSAEVYNFATSLPAPSGTQVSGMFRAITSARLGTVVSSYKKFGEQAITLEGGGGNHIQVDVDTTLVNRTINVQGRDGDGELVDSIAVLWLAGDHSSVEINRIDDLATAESPIVVPIDDEVPVMLRIRRGDRLEMFERVTPTTTAIDVTAPTGPELTSPVDAMQNKVVDTTAFATQPVPGATYVYGIYDDDGERPITYVTTTSAAFTAGRLRRLSAGLPAATGFQLRITAAVTPDASDLYGPSRTTLVGLSRTDGGVLMGTEKIGFSTATP
ncbi:MAG: hypothetical protein ACAI38_03515 [Myxococcota bacterium]|nr:hypothetical protein [Myxococcota bacterium]